MTSLAFVPSSVEGTSAYYPTLVNYRHFLFMRQYPLFLVELPVVESVFFVQKVFLRRV